MRKETAGTPVLLLAAVQTSDEVNSIIMILRSTYKERGVHGEFSFRRSLQIHAGLLGNESGRTRSYIECPLLLLDCYLSLRLPTAVIAIFAYLVYWNLSKGWMTLI